MLLMFLFHCAQCSKLLVDTSVIQFYPSKFVLITDILDNFGEPSKRVTLHHMTSLPPTGFLVYDRIRRKSMITPSGALKPVMLPGKIWSSSVWKLVSSLFFVSSRGLHVWSGTGIGQRDVSELVLQDCLHPRAHSTIVSITTLSIWHVFLLYNYV